MADDKLKIMQTGVNAIAARLSVYAAVFAAALTETIEQHGIPKGVHAWGHIVVLALVAVAVHKASKTDGTK
jgi:hypothetical protein